MKLVALLKGINVGGHKKISMQELRGLAETLGFTEVKTLINSGNLVLESGKITKVTVMHSLEKSIASHFGFPVDLIVRSKIEWKRYIRENPFSLVEKASPQSLHLGLSRGKLKAGVSTALVDRAVHGEKIVVVGDAIWIEFPEGVAKSKLTPRFLDQSAGSPVTLRNWNTVLKLCKMLEGE